MLLNVTDKKGKRGDKLLTEFRMTMMIMKTRCVLPVLILYLDKYLYVLSNLILV